MNKPTEATMRRVSENLDAFMRDLFSQALHATLSQCGLIATGVYSDEELEHWGRLYEENNFYKRGILFETFMTDPHAIAQAVFFKGWHGPLQLDDKTEFQPLLPKQHAAAHDARLEMCGRQCGKSIRAISRPLDTTDLVFLKKPLPKLSSADLCHWPVDDVLDIPIFLRKQAD